jgi:hypothetical protein
MHEQPGGAALLAAARDTVQNEILPLLPPESRVQGLMVLRAIAIVERELQAGADRSDTPHTRLCAIAGATDPLRRLSLDIRAGHYDPGMEGAATVHTLLTDLARARCAISNPKALREH